MKGYDEQPLATEEARGDWFHTGHLAYADDCLLVVVDRKDLVVRCGLEMFQELRSA